MQSTRSGLGSRTPESQDEKGRAASGCMVPVPYNAIRRKRSTESWRPVNKPVPHVVDAQDSVQVKSSNRATTKRQEALDLSACSRRESELKQSLTPELKKSLTLCKEQAEKSESVALIELLDFPKNKSDAKRQNSVKRRASSATEMIASSFAAANRPFTRTASQVFITPIVPADDVPARLAQMIPAFKANKVLNPRPGFANLPIKQNSKSLAHACGFQSLTLFNL
jgi:hypothetical protein